MKYFYEFNPRLGTDLEEKALAGSIMELKQAHSEPLIQFLHIVLNNLATLLVRPSVTEESAKVASSSFDAMATIVLTVQNLNLPCDKHERNVTLSSYLQYVFNAPQGQHSAGAFDSKTATLTKGRTASLGSSEEDYLAMASKFKGGSVRGTKGVSFTCKCSHQSILYKPHIFLLSIFLCCILSSFLCCAVNYHIARRVNDGTRVQKCKLYI